MGWPKGRKRFTPKDHNGRLMIVLRNRHVIWVNDVGPEDGPALRAKIQAAMAERPHEFFPPDVDVVHGKLPIHYPATVIDLAPHSEDTIRVEDIVHVKYQPPKSAGPEPEATKEP